MTRYRLCHPSRLADVKILTIQCVPSGASQRRKRSNALPCQWTRHRARDAPRAPPPPHAPTGTGRLALTPAAGVPVPGRQPGVKPAPVAQLSAGERRARCWCWCCRRPWSAGPGDGRGPCSPGCAMRERARHGWSQREAGGICCRRCAQQWFRVRPSLGGRVEATSDAGNRPEWARAGRGRQAVCVPGAGGQKEQKNKYSNRVSIPGLPHYQCDALPTVPSEQVETWRISGNLK